MQAGVNEAGRNALVAFSAFALAASAALAAPRTGPWTKERAWEWYDAQPWIRGCNYMPASAANRYDMWQVWDSDRRFEEMDRELALAESIGFNAVRVIVAEDNGFAVWCEDRAGYMRNLERFLALCEKHKIRAILCLGNDCSRPKELWSVPKPGPQPCDVGYHGGRKRSQHGSFPGAVGYISADDPALRPKFFEMCGEVMEKYKDDDRVLFWNIWNEPGNNRRGKVSAPLVKEMFELAWRIGVKQPCAADIWRGNQEPDKETAGGIAAAWSDIVSYHAYSPLGTQIKLAKELKKKFGRPMINTEWLARISGCDVQDCYPFFAQERIGCTCWGFVAGKYQTYEPWESMWRKVEKGYRGYKMTKWFHDLFRPSLRPYDPGEIDIIKHVNAQMDAEREGKSMRAKVAAKCRIVSQDMWQGFRRTHFDFNGRKAWIAEPSVAPRKDSAWIWNMLWPECDAGRMCVADLLNAGFHYAYIDLFDTRMDKTGVEAAEAFQSFLVNELGFAPKANLSGVSWGGFMAAQYAAAKPANVGKIYLDNALLMFDGNKPTADGGPRSWADATERVPPAWRDDPRMPVNLAPSIAKAGIDVLAVYGTSDAYVRPGANTKAFLEKFAAAGGKATVIAHSEYGHHPHGVEPDEADTVIQFFIGKEKRKDAMPRGDYVVAFDMTGGDDWKMVASELGRKHDAKIVEYEGWSGLSGVLAELRKIKPRYVCFVVPPETARREFVAAAFQMMRQLDDDPYGDAIWGIVTGYGAADGMRLVKAPPRREIRSIATSMGGDGTLDKWTSGFASDERTADNFWMKRPGGANEKIATGGNIAKALAGAFNSLPIDYFATSGHATERNWQIIYNQNKGGLVHTASGGLQFAEPGGGSRHNLTNASLKVYIGAGNCLIGHIDRRDCMATAWMHAAGVEQFAGYTVPSWYGFMGWGVKGLYEEGRYSLAEARYLENERLLWAKTRKCSATDAKGLDYDRDVFAYYGDPAQRIMFPEDTTPYKADVKGGAVEVSFTRDCTFAPLGDVRGARPVAVLLDAPPPGNALLGADGEEVPDSVVTERFIFIPAPGRHAAGEVRKFKIVAK